jgi:ferric-dicitrate binding protein FerR (iron transport regulator)
MTGGGLSSCKTRVPHGGTAARKRKRKLFGNAHGRFRTRGRNSSATVRGTKWSMTDTCSGTLTIVTRGVVTVRDFTLKKNRTVKAGHRYLARAPKLKKKH